MQPILLHFKPNTMTIHLQTRPQMFKIQIELMMCLETFSSREWKMRHLLIIKTINITFMMNCKKNIWNRKRNLLKIKLTLTI